MEIKQQEMLNQDETTKIIEATKQAFDSPILIETGKKIAPFLKGFRGKQGKAIAAVYPGTAVELYKLIQLYRELNVGFILQGANTALKGQGTPNGEDKPVVIIKTSKLNKIKVLNIPGNNEYKILLAQSGASLKEAEHILEKINFELPHKTGSHDLGNTFGASCANACGGVQVDNRDGRPSLTDTGNMGVVAIGTNGIIYNGFIEPQRIQSGKKLLERIDANDIEISDILMPSLNEINTFLEKLFFEKNYPIRNHRGEILFSGDGGEGLQAIVYQMYLIRKKPQKLRTYALLFKENLKEHFYKEVIFSEGPEKTDALPTLCESMNSNIVQEIVTNGFGFLSAILLALKNRWLTGHIQKLLSLRNQLIQLIPSVYIKFELFLGKYLSKLLIPSVIRKSKYKELLVLQVSERESNPGNIANFEKKLSQFIEHHPNALQLIQYQPHSFSEKIILNTRMSAALATLTLTIYKRGVLFPFDDAIMPGEMTESYASQLAQKLSELCPKHELLGPYLYGHDLKQINHNDWIITGELSEETLKKIHHVQCELVQAVGGHPHAEHGVGDYADTDLNYDELVKLVAHRLLNDVSGLANPGGAYQKAFKKAIEDKGIVGDAIQFAIKAIEREQTRFTLFNWNEALSLPKMMEVFHKNLEELRSRFQHEVN